MLQPGKILRTEWLDYEEARACVEETIVVVIGFEEVLAGRGFVKRRLKVVAVQQ